MKIFHLKRVQVIPVSLQQAWEFFSSPENLARITPPDMDFHVNYISGSKKMYPGQIIEYKIKVLPLVYVKWVTEITYVHMPFFFVDEQRFGPYALWHHQHHFRETDGGTEMMDEVNYALPLGPLGLLAHRLLVERRLNTIFDYRSKILGELFKSPSSMLKMM